MKKERVLQCVTCFAYCQLWSCKKKLLRCPKPYFLFDTLSKRDPTPCSLFFFSLSVNSLSLFLSFLFHFTIHIHFISHSLYTTCHITCFSTFIPPLRIPFKTRSNTLCLDCYIIINQPLVYTHYCYSQLFHLFICVCST